MSSNDPSASITNQAYAQSEAQRQMTVQLFENRQNAIGTVRKNRARNTAVSYAHKQQQWREWCHRMQFVDGECVTQDKLLTWMQEELFDRQIQPNKRKSDSIEDADETEEDAIRHTYSASTIDVYVSAVVDLHTTKRR